MRNLLATVVLAAAAASAAPGPMTTPALAPIVVVELFTSEGCSSCPPADTLLMQLTEAGATGATILTLSEHVDYWDQLGWRDPFSAELFSRRQSDYAARAFHSDRIYTPQVVVDGRLETVGSDAASVRSLVAQAARDPKAAVTVTATRQGTADLVTTIAIDAKGIERRGDADVLVAVVEDRLQNDVKRGENQGRTLAHTAVVRSLTSAGTISAKSAGFGGEARVAWNAAWKPADVRVIAFVQDKRTMRVVGAGAAAVR
ncbi:MAG TPA: DUF1223 domain-containing protein [Vicinamibacterales bacterium]|nr:DUF1223 domain-containing protein [Vicinamibacterales bacterium]